MKIKLNTGKEVYLEAFHCASTYAGLLVGSPTKESNEALIDHLSYPNEWGKKACVLKKSNMYFYENILKPISYSVWLSSSEPIGIKDKQSDGSALVILWFGEKQLDKSIQEIIVDGVGDIDWDKFADNFQF